MDDREVTIHVVSVSNLTTALVLRKSIFNYNTPSYHWLHSFLFHKHNSMTTSMAVPLCVWALFFGSFSFFLDERLSNIVMITFWQVCYSPMLLP